MLPKILERNFNIKPGDPLYDVEIKSHAICSEFHLYGLRVDKQKAEELLSQVKHDMKELAECIQEETKISNPNSSAQVGHWLYEQAKLLPPERTKSGNYSIRADILKKALDRNPSSDALQNILEYRTKLKHRSYLQRLLEKDMKFSEDTQTYRIYPYYDTVKTPTGRIYCSEPNLQSFPPFVKQVIIPDEGHYFLEADFVNQEMSIAGALSKERKILDALKNGEDLHIQTASEVLGVEPGEVTDSQRKIGKMLNYGILFGMSPSSLAYKLDIPYDEADRHIKRFFQAYPKLHTFIKRVVKSTKSRGYVETLFRRRRELPSINSSNPAIVAKAERQAINTPIQGTASDILKKTIVKLDALLDKNKIRMLTVVHDSILFQVRNDVPVFEATEIIKKNMAFKLPQIGLEIEVDVSDKMLNWSGKEFDEEYFDSEMNFG